MVYWNVQQYKNKIMDEIPISLSSNDLILDIGCGDGGFSEVFSKHANVIGVDLKLDPRWTRLKNPNIFFIRADAGNLPFKNTSVDVAFEKNVLHHVQNPNDAIAEIKRVSKNKSGACIIAEANRYNLIFYIHLTRLGDHQHFSKERFMELVKINFRDVNFSFTEVHVYPSKNSFILQMIRLAESIIERLYFVNKLCAYNIAIVQKKQVEDEGGFNEKN